MDDMQAERDRLAERLAAALTCNERLIEQREMEIAVNRRLRHEAAFGRSLLRLVEQLRRLRRAADAGRVPFDMGREAVVSAARDEIAEAWAEDIGSDAEAHETIDALAAVLQMFIGGGRSNADMLFKLTDRGGRLAERLDLVDAGLTWGQAKEAQRCEHPDMDRAIASLLNAGAVEQRDTARMAVAALLVEAP